MSDDRVQLNEPGDWTGRDYALGLLDELALSEALVHFKMSSDSSAYLRVRNASRDVFVRINARPTTRAERRQVLAHNGGCLRDHLAALLPRALGGRTIWAVPVWRRPAAAIREWRSDVHAARAVLIADVEEDEEIA